MKTIRKISILGSATALPFLALAHIGFAQSTTTASAPGGDQTNLAPKYDFGRFDDSKTNQQGAGFSMPDKIQLGDSVLQFDTSRKDNIPHGGLDNSDSSPLKAGIPSRDSSLIPPAYFGLTLTKPTR